ncbi:hypothetical protein GI374_13980 [Paracoccus sp. S-4012]|uniref:hypothetical protein n=1 Tax=Paracoccus sp. S-4012 TaxID=2665648 RepID=UPI0012B05224|nr:hypothetical protein [Paracoccus sp. S-4012]MRX51528.1 hypothetical protein [Paracoccus sp. S-4012]
MFLRPRDGRLLQQPVSMKSVLTYIGDLGRIEENYGDIDQLFESGELNEVQASIRLRLGYPEPRLSTRSPKSINRYGGPTHNHRPSITPVYNMPDCSPRTLKGRKKYLLRGRIRRNRETSGWSKPPA